MWSERKSLCSILISFMAICAREGSCCLLSALGRYEVQIRAGLGVKQKLLCGRNTPRSPWSQVLGCQGIPLLCQGSCWRDRSDWAFQLSNRVWPREAGEIIVVYFKIWLPGQLLVQTKPCTTGRWQQCPAALKVSNCIPIFPTLSAGIESSLSCPPLVSIPSWGGLHL